MKLKSVPLLFLLATLMVVMVLWLIVTSIGMNQAYIAGKHQPDCEQMASANMFRRTSCQGLSLLSIYTNFYTVL